MFKLLLITQICSLAGIILKEHPILCKFMFVARGTGGYKLLTGTVEEVKVALEGTAGGTAKAKSKRRSFHFSPSQCRCMMDTLGLALGIAESDRYNCMECLGCESQEGRREENVKDVFMLGQNLYTLDGNGRRFVKYFGSYAWLPMHPKSLADLSQPG
jgi:hypothetical protein